MVALNLKDIRISPANDYHMIDGCPLYQQRFQKVLKFHPPGLAPVKDNSGAYHIDVMGQSAYQQRYQDTFGFYENIAAAITDSGWCHINPVGQPIYKDRYDWCGNFQEQRCPVRDPQGNYFHILPNGKRLYLQNYRYAGDYKDSIVVVCRNDGLSSHIDLDGNLIHDQWYRQLDVFHKGFARAKDDKGWLHVSSEGRPVYLNRFLSLEPFYNGQAHAETFAGDLVVIDERGVVLHSIHTRG